MMKPEEISLLEKRKAGFDQFYNELVPTLVEFVGQMGINPAHEVLRSAAQFVQPMNSALQSMVVADEQDRMWLLTRLGYFLGEYFSQKYGGCWYVNEIPNSRYFARYVVGKFTNLPNPELMLDPFQIAQTYVISEIPRQLTKLLVEVDAELSGASG
jgi:hypothetical protein